ncbi:MAG: ROK family transcriptional regulator [Anaerolineae bacterium]|nr:ROK family transcriptional regulator [Anaerolineae bacterium]
MRNAPTPTITSAEMRAINRAAVLDCVRNRESISRSEIAETLNLSLPTVMRIVDELMAEGLVHDTHQKAWSGGRKRGLIAFNGEQSVMIGIDLGGTKIYGAVADLNGQILEEMVFTHHQSTAEESFGVLRDSLNTLIERAQATGRRLVGLTVGVPGAVDPASGIVSVAPSLEWYDFPLKERLRAVFDLPIAVENDVNLAALGELWFGANDDARDLVLIAIGTGIGAGIVLNGLIHTGRHHMAGEIGYLLPTPAHLNQTYPGFGALEMFAAGPGVAERARERLKNEWTASQLASLTAEDVFSAARQDRAWAQAVVAETVDYLAQAVAAVSLLYDPDVIILGGGVARSADLLVHPILERLRGVIPFQPALRASPLGYRAGVLGGIVTLMRMTANYYILNKFA